MTWVFYTQKIVVTKLSNDKINKTKWFTCHEYPFVRCFDFFQKKNTDKNSDSLVNFDKGFLHTKQLRLTLLFLFTKLFVCCFLCILAERNTNFVRILVKCQIVNVADTDHQRSLMKNSFISAESKEIEIITHIDNIPYFGLNFN